MCLCVLTVDLDECTLYSPCPVGADCINTDGSYLCQCRSGYSGDGYTCTGRYFPIIIIIINKVLIKVTFNKVIAGTLYIVICG